MGNRKRADMYITEIEIFLKNILKALILFGFYTRNIQN